MKKLIIAALTCIGLSANAAQVSPTPETQVDHSGTATGSAVTVLVAGSSGVGYRVDCFLQNNGTHVMYYSFTGTATSGSKQLAAGTSMNCLDGVSVTVTALSLLGTASDAYALTESFVSGQ